MSNNTQSPNHMQQLPQMIAQYQQNIEYLNNSIAQLRRNMERTDISPEEREVYKKQEQDLQGKLNLHQTLVNNLAPQMVAQNIQQRGLNQQMSPTSDNMSTPGSPATYNQQQLANFANNPAAQQQQQQLRTAQQQQAMNKMGAAVAAAQQQQQLHQQQQQQQPQQQQQQQQQLLQQQQQQQQQIPQTFPSPTPVKPNNAAQAAVAAAAQVAAQAAVKNNNGMFTFPTNTPLGVTPATPTGSTPATPTTAVPPMTTPAPTLKPSSAPSLDNDGVNRVLTKRKIQELVSQIDPTERLEPEVEDILLEIADEFIESVTTFACQLAKHRKSDTLEVKDVQLHLERNWNIRIPGFASDDIRPLRKPTIPSSHQAKLQAVNAAKSQITNTSQKKESNN